MYSHIQLSLYDRNSEQIYHFRDGKKKKIFEVCKKKSFITKCRHVVNGNTFLGFCLIHNAQIM